MSTLRKTAPPAPTSSKSDLREGGAELDGGHSPHHQHGRRNAFRGELRVGTAGHATHGAIIRPVAATEVVRPRVPAARERSYEELEQIFAGVDAPFALVDLDAMWSNAREMLARAAGTPIRVASKSVRCRSLLAAMLGRDPGFRGLMTFTLPESLWLHGHGFDDLLLAYPTAHRGALAELARLETERPPIVMVDSVEQLDYIEAAAGARRAADPGLPRVRHELVAARRADQGGRQALADPHARNRRRRWRARSWRAPRFELAARDGLRGAHRRGRRPAARESACRAR